MTSPALTTILLAAIFCAPAWARAQDAKDAQYAAALQQAERALELRQFEDALDGFKRANALRNKQSAEAQFGMARAHRAMQAPKKAVDSCTDALKYAGGNADLEAAIRNLRGLALFDQIEKNDDRRLKDAEADFRAVTELTRKYPIAHYNLGFSMLRQGRDAEGVEALKTFLAMAPYAKETAEARRLIENPHRARVVFAPEFSVTALDGQRVALEDLRGRVVLVDFWATWCGPCVAATPGLKRLAKKYADAPFTIVGVSLDRNEQAWRNYVEREKMDWPQYLDNGRIANLYKVKPIPTYFVIDHEGVIRATRFGYSSGTDGWLDSEIRKCLKDVPAAGGSR